MREIGSAESIEDYCVLASPAMLQWPAAQL
jgi:hypothetical protein